MRKEAAPFYLERVRRITKSFSWIDRDLIHLNVLPYYYNANFNAEEHRIASRKDGIRDRVTDGFVFWCD